MDEYNTLDLASLGATDKAGDTYVKGRDDKKIKKQSDDFKKKKDDKTKAPANKQGLPPGAVGYKHGWIPVDASGKAVGPAQKPAYLADAEAKHKAAGGLSVEGYKKQAIQKRLDAAKKAEDAKKHAAEAKKTAAANKVTSAKNKAAAAQKRDASAKATAAHKAEAEKKKGEKEGAIAHKEAVDKQLVGSDPKALSDEALAAAITAAKTKLADSGYSPEAQKIVDGLKEELSARAAAPDKAATDQAAATQHVAQAMHEQKQGDAQVERDQVKEEAAQKKEAASPQAKRALVEKQAAVPDSAAARALAKLPKEDQVSVAQSRAKKALADKQKNDPALKDLAPGDRAAVISGRNAKTKHTAVLTARAKKAAAREKLRLANASTEVKQKSIKQKKVVKLTNGTQVVLDFSQLAPKGQLAFRYKHGWILINPLIPSRGRHGSGLAVKHHVKSGTTTKGHFEKSEKGTNFVPESYGHPSMHEQMQITKAKLGQQLFQAAQAKEDKALREEVKKVKNEVAVAHANDLTIKAGQASMKALNTNEHSQAKVDAHKAAYEAHTKAQTAQADVGNTDQAAKHSDAALIQQKAAHTAQGEADAKFAHKKDTQAKAISAYGDAFDAPEGTLAEKQAKALAWLDSAKASQAALDAGNPASLLEAKVSQAKQMAADLDTEIIAHIKKAKAEKSTPTFKTVALNVQMHKDGEAKTIALPGKATPSGKLIVHKSPTKKSKYVISGPGGHNLSGAYFNTQKEAKAAALEVEKHYPGEAFTKEDFQATKVSHPEEFDNFKQWVMGAVDTGDWSEPKTETFTPVGAAGGSHGAQIFEEKKGMTTKKWIKKTDEVSRLLDPAIAAFHKDMGVNTPEFKQTKDGSVQHFIPGSTPAFPNGVKINQLDVQNMVRYQILDYITANHDSHSGNWISTPRGIQEIDQGMSFKLGHSHGPDYFGGIASGGDKPVYPVLKKLADSGDVKVDLSPDTPAGQLLGKIQDLSDEQLTAYFEDYAKFAVSKGLYPSVDNFNAQLIEKKNSAAEEMAKLYPQTHNGHDTSGMAQWEKDLLNPAPVAAPVSDGKKKAVDAAWNALPPEETPKLSPAEWKEYFGNVYDVEVAAHANNVGLGAASSKLLLGPNPNAKGVSMLSLTIANEKLSEHVKADPIPELTVPDKIHLGPAGGGMNADGLIIKKAVADWVAAEGTGNYSPGKIEAWHAAIMDAKREFSTKHGKPYDASKVSSPQPVTSTFVPPDEFFSAALAAGYHRPLTDEDVNHGWEPPYASRPALSSYTGSGYTAINSLLRKNKKPKGDGSYDSDIVKKVAAMDKAFDAAPGLDKPMVTIRRLSTSGPFPDSPPPMTAGAEFIDYGYGSTAKTTTAWGGSVTMEVRMPAGTKVIDVNHNLNTYESSEQEIILDRGARYRVVSDTPGKGFGQRKIVVEVVNTRNEG